MRKRTHLQIIPKKRFVALAFAITCLVIAFAKLAPTELPPDTYFKPPQLLHPLQNFVPSNAPKEEFTVSILCGGHVQCDRGIKAVKKSIEYYHSKLDVSFKIEKIIRNGNQPAGGLLERWGKWFTAAEFLGTTQYDLTIILVENFPDNVSSFDFQEEGIIGLASGIGNLGVDPSALIVKLMGSEQFMTRLIIHEIGHTLGGTHIEEGIMHPSASANQYSDELSDRSLNQMREHLRAVKILRKIKTEVIAPILPKKETKANVAN